MDCLELLEDMEKQNLLDMDKVFYKLDKMPISDINLRVADWRGASVSDISCRILPELQNTKSCQRGFSFHKSYP